MLLVNERRRLRGEDAEEGEAGEDRFDVESESCFKWRPRAGVVATAAEGEAVAVAMACQVNKREDKGVRVLRCSPQFSRPRLRANEGLCLVT